ncbi:sialate O-acetylesterase [Acrasis kona]|uniref:Sialate O-acetylesterase n=1 Tax=Acrasis kona TaxID=1008807 RepID=A0AAW2YRM8_9EUKA
MIKVILFLSVLFVLTICQDDHVYPLLGSNMVLQRNSNKTKLWGSTSSSIVNIQLRKSEVVIDNYEAKSVSGKWEVTLKSYPAGGPYQILVKTASVVVYQNVMFGDVYLCSGQSNMEFTINRGLNASSEVKDSVNYPNIHFFKVAHNDSPKPVDNVRGQWRVPDPSIGEFSAACYFFARNIYKALNGEVPIGLIESTWGGTPIQVWSSPDAIKQCNQTNGPSQPNHLWNGQIVPLLKYNVKAALWYQGENNAGRGHDLKVCKLYSCQLQAMIRDWRAKWNVGDFPFYFVLLAGFRPGNNWAEFRLAQLEALHQPHTYFATAMDIGDREDIHPKDKQEVGRRLSLIALNQIYGKSVAYKGPTLKSVKSQTSSKSATITVDFDHVVGAIVTKNTPKCKAPCCSPGNLFRITTSTRKDVVPNNVQIKANIITLTFDKNETEQFKELNYAMFPFPECVYIDNNTLLPVNAFRYINK